MSTTNNTNSTPVDTTGLPAPAQVVAGKRTRYKRARSAYAFYASDKSVRVSIQTSNPSWKFGDVSKELGKRWKDMDASARQTYEDQSTSEKSTLSANPGPVQKRGRSAPK